MIFFLHGINKNALLAFSQNRLHGTASEKVSSFQNDDDDNNNSNNNDDDADCDNKINKSHDDISAEREGGEGRCPNRTVVTNKIKPILSY